MSGASALCLGTLCLARSCVRAADMHDVCPWLVSLELAQLSSRGTMVTLSSEYAADRCAELSPFPGLAGYFVLGMLSRQGRDARLARVALACELRRSFQVVARWSLQVASAADRCAELSPLPSITAPCRPEMSGASAFGYFVVRSCVRAAYSTTCACGSGVRAVAQLSGRGTVVTSGREYC